MQIFPRWTAKLPPVMAVASALGGGAAILGVWYYFSPQNTDVGYQPDQPVPYSHKLHAGDLGIDCRYCHVGAEKGAHAVVPPTQTCMNCHRHIKKTSPKLQPIRDSWADNRPVEWVKIHKVADYAFFNHSAHITAGVGCKSCHGRIDEMVKVKQVQPLSMGWCLECHRDPAKHLRPADKITKMDWEPPKDGTKLPGVNYDVHPPEHCSGCHR